MPEVQSKKNVSIQRPQAVMLSMQEAQWQRLNTAANNLANASTYGFKSHILKTEEVKQKSRDSKMVSFIKTAGVVRDMSSGGIHRTGNPLEVALIGPGYFMVKTPSGNRYTRNGQFTTNIEGQLVMASTQFPVLGESGSEISLPVGLKGLSIGEDGSISANGQVLGRLAVVSFDNEQGLQNEGSNLYKTSEDAKPTKDTQVIQGALEESNVSPMQESINLMEILRAFENAQKIIDEFEQLQRKALNASARNV
jgi:flagellar basal-body rod protein FlgF